MSNGNGIKAQAVKEIPGVDAGDINAVMKGKNIATSVKSFIDGYNAIDAGQQAAQAGYSGTIQVAGNQFKTASQAVSWGKNVSTNAVKAVADIAIQEFDVLEGKDAKKASIAVNTAYFVAIAAGFATFGVGTVLTAASTMMTINSLFSSPPRVYWKGKVNINFNEKYPYQYSVSVSTIDESEVGDISDKVKNAIETNVTNKINSSLSKLDKESSDFALKYAVRPESEMTLDVDIGRAGSDAGEKFSRKLSEQLVKVGNEIKRSGTELSYLHFLSKIQAEDLVNQIALDKVPQLKYKVEGEWRKELERLAIKLMQRREYTRQIELMLHALIYEGFDNSGNIAYHDWKKYGGARIYKISANNIYSRKINEGRSYIVGNPPHINLHNGAVGASNPDSPFRTHKNSGIPPRSVRIKTDFKIRPQKTSKGIKFELYDITGYIEYGYNIRKIRFRTYPDANTWRAPLTNSFKNALKHSISFTNHLIGEIPDDAAKYIKNNVGTTDAYIILELDVNGVRSRDVGKGFMHDLELVYANNYRSNYPAQLNAQMQDVIDLYKFWQKGYAEEFKRRVRDNVMHNMLPTIRDGIYSDVKNMAQRYSSYPNPEEAASEVAIKTMKNAREEAKKVKDYLPIIKKRKQEIIDRHGEEEYNKLLERAKKRRRDLIKTYVDNAANLSSKKLLNKEFGEGITVSKQEAQKLIAETFSRLKKDHPDISDQQARQLVQEKLQSTLNVKKGSQKKDEETQDAPATPEEQSSLNMPKVTSSALDAWNNLGTTGKVVAGSTAALILFSYLS